LLLACAGAFAAPPHSAAKRSAVELPATPVGQLGRSLLAAVNHPDAGKIADFVRASISAEGLKMNPAASYDAALGKLRDQSGGLELGRFEEPGPHMLVLDVRSRRGTHWVRVVLRMSPTEPGKLNGIMLLPLPRSYGEGEYPWPEGRQDEAGVVRAIEGLLTRAAADDELSGVVLVSRGGRVVLHKAYGMADKGFGVPNGLNTKFHLGSMDKMFTAVAVGQLVQEGKLSFDDRLAKVLPDYPDKQVAEKITIRHLLTHTSGLGDIFKPAFYEHRDNYRNSRDYFPLFSGEPLRFEPGAKWSYSNAGYVVLGAVVEKVSGQNYFDYVRERIFRPAGMNDTGAYEINEVVPDRAVGYLRDADEDPLGVLPRRSNVLFVPFKGCSAGGGYSTAPDLLKFAEALRAHRLLNVEMTETVTSGKVGFTGPFGPEKYGFGFVAFEVGGKEVRGNSGGGPSSGISSEMDVFWDSSWTVIVLTNYDAPGASRLARQVCKFLARQ
jgi:CubicO group peptidase (beta-lactamase class C family)